MYLTIEEAKDRYCCTDRSKTSIANKCIADRCMAWRKEVAFIKPEENSVSNQTFPKPPTKPEAYYTGKGYCGLTVTPY